MSSFIGALMKQRKAAKKAEPDTSGRLREIIAVLKKYNYDDGITPEVTVSILQDLGPTFVKIGQIASQQSEYLPPAYCEALTKLRSKVAPMDIETVYAQIEKYLGKPVNELYASFDEKPLGSASVAQVHRAELFDGTVVAVKVRRQGVVDTVARDFALIEKVLDKFAKKGKDGIDIKGLIVELENTSKSELDFTNEANNLDRFYANNSGREGIESPKCYRELTCEAVLTEDFVSGTEVSDADFLATLGDDERERIAALVADNFASQILTDGFYHADPHSGNVLIKAPVRRVETEEPEAAGEENAEKKIPLPEHGVEWIDFGMMGSLSKPQRQILLDMVTALVMQNAYNLKTAALKIAQPQGEVNHGALLELCETMCGQYSGADFGDFDLGDLLSTVMGALSDANYKVDPFVTNLARGVVAMEGTIKTISPKVNMLNFFMDKISTGLGFNLDLDNPKNMNPDIAIKLVQLFQGVTDSSTKSASALDMLEKGQLKAHMDLSIEEKSLKNVNRFVSYTVQGLIIFALIIGACILCAAPAVTIGSVTLTWLFPLIGIIILIVSLILAICLVTKIKKGNK
ncbi:MAG: AarF/ABC1/UbiB kinase family protein [Lachnospiraceae bacterium]|nr:AarF/ABC1/UbiB kinase family protein [Lachnospiraceae bacterium]